MMQVVSHWQMRAVASGTRFHHFILSNSPYEDWQRIMGIAGFARPHTSAIVTPYDVARHHDVVAHGGFTHHTHERDPVTHGFAVSLDPEQGGVSTFHRLRDFLPDHIAEHREQARGVLDHGSYGRKVYQGGWLDTDTNGVGIETTHVNADEGQARDFAIKHKQKAYYDLDKNETTFFNPLHDPHFRGEEGPEKQLHAIDRYADIGHRFGRVMPEEYHSYEHLYPLPEHVRRLQFDARLREETRAFMAKAKAQSDAARYQSGAMVGEERERFEAESRRRWIYWSNTGGRSGQPPK